MDPLGRKSERFWSVLSGEVVRADGRWVGGGANKAKAGAPTRAPAACCHRWLSLLVCMFVFVLRARPCHLDRLLFLYLKIRGACGGYYRRSGSGLTPPRWLETESSVDLFSVGHVRYSLQHFLLASMPGRRRGGGGGVRV